MDRPSRPNPRRLKAKLALAGWKVRAFARQHGFKESTVKKAIAGTRFGEKSRAVVAAINAL